MSRSNVRKTINNKILQKLEAEESKRTKKLSQKLSGNARPHVIYLENVKFITDAVKFINEHYGKDKLKGIRIQRKGALDKARELAKKRQGRYIKARKLYKKGKNVWRNTPAGKVINERDSSLADKIDNGTAYVIQSWYQIGQLKKEIVDSVVTGTEAQMKLLKSSVDRGHGADGDAVSNLTIQRGLAQLDSTVDDPDTMRRILDDLALYVDNAIKVDAIDASFASELKQITINYKTNITKDGKIRAEYVPYITYQDRRENRDIDAPREKANLDLVRKFFQEGGSKTLVDIESSSSIRDRAIARVLEPIIKIDSKTKKVTIDKSIDARKIGFVANDIAKSDKKKNTTRYKKSRVGKKNIPLGRKTKAKQSAISFANIIGVINAQLPAQVIKNMGPPALENRTGRFASSVRAMEVMTTKQGYPSVGYTYQKNPYQVFESTSGSRFASTQRDPRVIIDKSIREIMAKYLVGRLYTRRV